MFFHSNREQHSLINFAGGTLTPKNRELEESVYRREQLQVKMPEAGNRVIPSHVWHKLWVNIQKT